jgi:hypothetical protein
MKIIVVQGILLVSLGFALGYIWARNAAIAPIIIERCAP